MITEGANATKRSRHFIIKTAYIRDQVELGNMIVQHVQGVHNHSDILTKPSLATFFTDILEGFWGWAPTVLRHVYQRLTTNLFNLLQQYDQSCTLSEA